MQELSLFAQIPVDRYEQVMNVLAGISAMQPSEVRERHLIFKPRRKPNTAAPKIGGSQALETLKSQTPQKSQSELFYLKLVGNIRNQQSSRSEANQGIKDVEAPVEGETLVHSGRSFIGHTFDSSKSSWTMRFSDLPEVPGRRPVTLRMVTDVTLSEGNVLDYMNAFGYDFMSEHCLEGQQFVHHNVILLIHRLLQYPPENKPDNGQALPPREKAPALSSLKPFDPSGAYVLQASVRIQPGSKPETVDTGMNELRVFQDMMRGVIGLDLGDRLALDTRVK